MKKLIFVLLFLSIPQISFSDIILMKNGKTISGKIVERTEEYLKVDSGIGINITIYTDQIKKEIPDENPPVDSESTLSPSSAEVPAELIEAQEDEEAEEVEASPMPQI